jgi:hypothetical protein
VQERRCVYRAPITALLHGLLLPPLTGYMLRCLNRLSVRYFLIFLAISIYILIDSFLCLLDSCVVRFGYRPRPPDFWIGIVVKHIYVNLFLVAWGGLPPLLSLFLLRRPSFWRVLFHVAATFYPLWILITMAQLVFRWIVTRGMCCGWFLGPLFWLGCRRRWRLAGGRDLSTTPCFCFGFLS